MISRGVSMAGPCIAGPENDPASASGSVEADVDEDTFAAAGASAGLMDFGCASDEAWPNWTITHNRKTDPVIPPANVQRWDRRADTCAGFPEATVCRSVMRSDI